MTFKNKSKMQKKKEDVYTCQFCGKDSPTTDWKDDKCPKCGKAYNAILAQEGDD
jgi:rubrerythrin